MEKFGTYEIELLNHIRDFHSSNEKKTISTMRSNMFLQKAFVQV